MGYFDCFRVDWALCICNLLGNFEAGAWRPGCQGKDARALGPNPGSQGQGRGLALKASLVRNQGLCLFLCPQDPEARRKVI